MEPDFHTRHSERGHLAYRSNALFSITGHPPRDLRVSTLQVPFGLESETPGHPGFFSGSSGSLLIGDLQGNRGRGCTISRRQRRGRR